MFFYVSGIHDWAQTQTMTNNIEKRIKGTHSHVIGFRGDRSHIFRPQVRSFSKITNPQLKFFIICESDSCSNSGSNPFNRNSAMFAMTFINTNQPPTAVTAENKKWLRPGSGFSQIFKSFVNRNFWLHAMCASEMIR